MKTCYYCKGPLRRRRIEHMHSWRGQHFLIKNVGAEVCVQCGEAFLAPATLKEIDRVVNRERPQSHLKVAVYALKSRAA
jgi:YgiT-type zinc finger domain-containing protein